MNDQITQLQARIADLEAQLYAIGAGGVGQSIQPQVQPDTTPAAWAIFTKSGFCRMWAQDRALIERTAAELGVKAEPMYRCTGRAPQPARQPTRQPLPVDTYTALAHRIATKYTHRSDPAFCGYAFLPNTLEQFVRAIEQAHGITGGKP